MGIKITGLRGMAERYYQAGEKVKAAAKGALREIGEEIMTESMRRVPVGQPGLSYPEGAGIPGTLRNSRHVEIRDEGDDFEVVLQYRAPYAFFVHERQIDPPYSNGTRKYLQGPIDEREPFVIDDLAQKVRKRLA
jgi:hypothetical protein